MRFLYFFLIFLVPYLAFGRGNTEIESFDTAKYLMIHQIYYDHPFTIYCNAEFDSNKNVVLPDGFTTDRYYNRANIVEAEHIVPAENFGRNFIEWRDGSKVCVSHGRKYRNRKCATKASRQYRLMQADLYNLYPAIGTVNAVRQNYEFTMLPKTESLFGTCEMKLENRKIEPPERARGAIARTYLYMDWAYDEYSMSDKERNIMKVWNKQYPVDEWECERAKRIKQLQGNENPFVLKQCF